MGMTIDKAKEWLELAVPIKALTQEEFETFIQAVNLAIDTMSKYQQLEDFARWVATEVIDEEMWTYNHLAFAELACRKLVQLGIMQESDGEYSYEEDTT